MSRGHEADDTKLAVDALQALHAWPCRFHQLHGVGRELLANKAGGLRTPRKHDAIAISNGQRTIGKEPRSRLPQLCQMLGQPSKIEPGYQSTGVPVMTSGKRQN